MWLIDGVYHSTLGLRVIKKRKKVEQEGAEEGVHGAENPAGRQFFIDNLLVRIHFTIMMMRWTGLAPGEFAFPFPGSKPLMQP